MERDHAYLLVDGRVQGGDVGIAQQDLGIGADDEVRGAVCVANAVLCSVADDVFEDVEKGLFAQCATWKIDADVAFGCVVEDVEVEVAAPSGDVFEE